MYPHLILAFTLWATDYYFCFINEEIEAQRDQESCYCYFDLMPDSKVRVFPSFGQRSPFTQANFLQLEIKWAFTLTFQPLS